jgi:lipid A ethanolaminephosphotransferase
MLAWLAPGTRGVSGLTLDCLQRERNKTLSHDNLFHTTLGVLGIRASEYVATLDAFAACRAP